MLAAAVGAHKTCDQAGKYKQNQSSKEPIQSELRTSITSYGQLYNPQKNTRNLVAHQRQFLNAPQRRMVSQCFGPKWLGWLEQNHNLRSFSCCQAAVRCWHERKGPAGSMPIYILTNHFEQQRLWVKSMVFACLCKCHINIDSWHCALGWLATQSKRFEDRRGSVKASHPAT